MSTKPQPPVTLFRSSQVHEADRYDDLKALLNNRLESPISVDRSATETLPTSERADTIFQLLMSAHHQVLWAARGGEGTADLIPYLDDRLPELKTADAKTVIGLSDTTPLLCYLSEQLEWPCYYGPCASQLLPDSLAAVDDASIDRVLRVASSRDPILPWLPDLTPMNPQARDNQAIEGQLVGGNLTMLGLAVGDIWQPNLSGKICIIEDWHEAGYRVDRTLKYLTRVGFFSGVTALIIGDFTAHPLDPDPVVAEQSRQYLAGVVLPKFAETAPFPVYQTSFCGHGPQSYLWPYGTAVRLGIS